VCDDGCDLLFKALATVLSFKNRGTLDDRHMENKKIESFILTIKRQDRSGENESVKNPLSCEMM
jgi:hypothetical protein